ncbi:ABC transporter ATP-binding protein [Microbacterium abyssi]|uniref:ABC transporter ATP-binding protein n=1 Tax=Microbacterium abyssi TaxID=2782166 RepID=UPI001E2DF2BB|nr:ABC transporter ATP-binding protein [Microbacterium sp. A18JL241]
MTASLDDHPEEPDDASGATAEKKATTTKSAAVKAVAARPSKPAAKRTTAAKAATAKTEGAKATAAKKTTAARTGAAKAAAAKTASSRTAAAKTTAKSAASKTTAAKTAAAKAAAAKAAATKAAKAAAAKAAKEEAAKAETESRDAAATAPSRVKPLVASEDAAATAETIVEPEVLADLGLAAESEPAAVVEAEPVVDAAPAAEAEPVVEAEPAAEREPAAKAGAIADDELNAESDAEPQPVPGIDAAAEAVVTDVPAATATDAIVVRGLVKAFGDHRAVNGIDLTVPAGSFYGIVGPNGAGKTTTLSILAGLLSATTGEVEICGIDQSENPLAAKRVLGVLPDRLRTFDRLTGRQLLHYYGLLRGLSADVIEKRSADLMRAFDLSDAALRVVSDYSAGMTKKIMLAGAMIHSPRVLVLDEPFESVDPVSSAVILDILRAYVSHGGTVILSSHGMDLVERVCSRVAIIVAGDVLAEGTVDEVRAGQTLESRFIELAGGTGEVEGLEWLHTFSD